MKLGVVAQARLDSSRLPNKALLPLGGKPMLLRVLEALQTIPADVHILACSEDSAEAFRDIALQAGFELVPGPKDDVLHRFILAVDAFRLDWVIRATADNPFVFADAADFIARESIMLEADYGTFAFMPYGSGVEVIRAEALYRAHQETTSPYDREHVCPYLYGNPSQFALHRPLTPNMWRFPQVRLTVDTPEDYQQAQGIYEQLSSFDKTGNSESLIPSRYQGSTILAAYRCWKQEKSANTNDTEYYQ
ncbi:MAG: NTP transferase domain-containing protein [Termitinemataceae bacterium]